MKRNVSVLKLKWVILQFVLCLSLLRTSRTKVQLSSFFNKLGISRRFCNKKKKEKKRKDTTSKNNLP